MTQRRPVVIEQTAKKWKAAQLAGAAVLLCGFVLLVVAPPVGVIISFIGLAAFLGARLGAWWHHG